MSFTSASIAASLDPLSSQSCEGLPQSCPVSSFINLALRPTATSINEASSCHLCLGLYPPTSMVTNLYGEVANPVRTLQMLAFFRLLRASLRTRQQIKINIASTRHLAPTRKKYPAPTLVAIGL